MAPGSQLEMQLVPCFLLVILIAPCSHAKPCRCPESSDVPRVEGSSFRWDLNAMEDAIYSFVTADSDGFSLPFTRHELMEMPKETRGLVCPRYAPEMLDGLVGAIRDDNGFFRATGDEASFTVSFTMSVYPIQTRTEGRRPITNSLAFVILPNTYYDGTPVEAVSLTEMLSLGAGGSMILSDAVPKTEKQVSVQIGRVWIKKSGRSRYQPELDEPFFRYHRPLAVNITIMVPPAAASANYTVWIDYYRLRHSLSVYVAVGEGKTRPRSPIAYVENAISFNHTAYVGAQFGILSTIGQFLQVRTWNMWVEGLPDYYGAIAADKRKLFVLEVFLPIHASIILMAIGVGVALYLRSKQRKWEKEQEKLAKTMQRLPGVPTQVDFADIRKATADFHETMKLGNGGFSSVYRCKLPAAAAAASRRASTMEVAVKKFTRDVEEQRYEDFLAEVSIINRLRHKNIVPLVGWSYHKGVPLLIYEYMTNGSLDQHLFKQQGDTSFLQWHTRYSIVWNIATGLHYVHHEHEPMVLHRDIKASNIMLDTNFHARLGDFGIACTVAADRSSVTGLAGTRGYIAPDYAMSNRATRQTDIYAFGVLVLEVVTGKKNRDVPPDDGHISDWVWRLHGEGKLLEAVNEHQQDVVEDEAERLLLLGLACTNPNPSNRPSMAAAVQVITELAPPPDIPPERPAFVWPPQEWRSLDSDYSTTESNLGGISAGTVELEQIIQNHTPPGTQSTTFFSV